MGTNGALVTQERRLFSASTSMQGGLTFMGGPLQMTLNPFFRRSYGGYDSPDWGHGVRDFVFHAHNVTKGVDTWIRLEEGTRRAIVKLDKDFK